MKKQTKITLISIIAAMALVLAACLGYLAFEHNYTKEEKEIKERLDVMKPTIVEGEPIPTCSEEFDRLRALNPDIKAWITVPNTNIDYPVLQGESNDSYIHTSALGKYLYSGSIFMDYRVNDDLSSKNTVIYGHHMKNGEMFADLRLFCQQEFFDQNKVGYLFTPDKVYKLEFFCADTVSKDSFAYDTTIIDSKGLREHCDKLKSGAKAYREMNLSGQEKIVTLSTCAYVFKNSRYILCAKLTEMN